MLSENFNLSYQFEEKTRGRHKFDERRQVFFNSLSCPQRQTFRSHLSFDNGDDLHKVTCFQEIQVFMPLTSGHEFEFDRVQAEKVYMR